MKRLRYLWPGYRRAEEREMQEELAALEAIAGRRELGNLTLAAENARGVWGWEWLQSLVRDARYAAARAGAAAQFRGGGGGVAGSRNRRQCGDLQPDGHAVVASVTGERAGAAGALSDGLLFVPGVSRVCGEIAGVSGQRDRHHGDFVARPGCRQRAGAGARGNGVRQLLPRSGSGAAHRAHADAGGRQRRGSECGGAELPVLAARLRRRAGRNRPDAARGQRAVHDCRRGAAGILRRGGGRSGGGVGAHVHAAHGVPGPALAGQPHALSQPAGHDCGRASMRYRHRRH